MTLPDDYARCPGTDWDECDDCQRRTSPGGEQQMQPPRIVTLWCESYIPPDRPEDQRLRELAAGLGGAPRFIRQCDDGWEGADQQEGPWRPIPAPQAGAPWGRPDA